MRSTLHGLRRAASLRCPSWKLAHPAWPAWPHSPDDSQEQQMDKTNPPKAFGVFKPVGHTVIAFASAAELQVAVNLLTEAGFAASSWVIYSPAEMKAQVDLQLQTASPLASLGYELDLVNAHGVLAEKGCS